VAPAGSKPSGRQATIGTFTDLSSSTNGSIPVSFGRKSADLDHFSSSSLLMSVDPLYISVYLVAETRSIAILYVLKPETKTKTVR